MVNYQGILERYMRNDRVTVVRQVEAVDDIGADIFTETVVYADIPCKLGQAGKNTLDNTPTNSVTFVTADLRLCLAPEYTILANDKLIVKHKGQTFTFWATQAFKYMTHQEISVYAKTEA
ncbi:hypothetical protein [uncultured Veillonella sp.]|uniref:hypothetical protein n=1 Tax=uncultured Veillonella sp. TaxID=159268 RepID=UPI00280AC897|nr:hypothetical protein [uncultured Veillonella sp.]